MSRRNDIRVIMLSAVWCSDDVGQSFRRARFSQADPIPRRESRSESDDGGLDGQQIGRFRLRGQQRALEPPLALGENRHIRIVREDTIQGREFVAHRLLDLLQKLFSLRGSYPSTSKRYAYAPAAR